MSLRSGSEYVESLDDGRAVFLDGERVEKVPEHPAFASQVRVIADLYDGVRASAVGDGLWEEDPQTGDRVSLAWQIPKSVQDLEARRRLHEFWARGSYGLMGRTPDPGRSPAMAAKKQQKPSAETPKKTPAKPKHKKKTSRGK
jgi:4-hydroxyphenylacetate 3-monooxygenase